MYTFYNKDLLLEVGLSEPCTCDYFSSQEDSKLVYRRSSSNMADGTYHAQPKLPSPPPPADRSLYHSQPKLPHSTAKMHPALRRNSSSVATSYGFIAPPTTAMTRKQYSDKSSSRDGDYSHSVTSPDDLYLEEKDLLRALGKGASSQTRRGAFMEAGLQRVSISQTIFCHLNVSHTTNRLGTSPHRLQSVYISG